jgi:pilus assembly protein CpaE
VPYLRNIDAELMNDIVEEHGSGVKLLLAPPSPQEAEVVTPDLVRGALSVMAEMHDFIVVDTRPAFDDLNLGIFDISDVMLLVVTMDMTAIKDARQFLEVTDLLGYSSEKVRLVLNRNNTYSGIPAEEIGASLRRTLWARIPDEPGPVQRSVNEGIPLVCAQGDSKVAEEINRMAGELLAEISPDSIVQPAALRTQRAGLLGRIKTGKRTDLVEHKRSA